MFLSTLLWPRHIVCPHLTGKQKNPYFVPRQKTGCISDGWLPPTPLIFKHKVPTLCLSKKNKQRQTHFPFSSYHVVFKPLNKITVGIGMGAFATKTLPWLLFALAEHRHLSTHARVPLSAAGHTPTHLGLTWPCSSQREPCTSYSGVSVFLSLFLPGFSVTFRSDLSSKKVSQMLESINPLHSVLMTLCTLLPGQIFFVQSICPITVWALMLCSPHCRLSLGASPVTGM